MSFVATDPAGHKGQTDIWLTPLELVKRIGTFDLDPCGFPGHHTAERLITLPNDGLKQNWNGKVWLNPPYSEQEKWVDKLTVHGFGCALLFARTGSKWMQRAIRAADSICFIRGRISFMRPDGSYESNAGADSIVLCFGCEVEDKSLGVLL